VAGYTLTTVTPRGSYSLSGYIKLTSPQTSLLQMHITRSLMGSLKELSHDDGMIEQISYLWAVREEPDLGMYVELPARVLGTPLAAAVAARLRGHPPLAQPWSFASAWAC